LRPEAAATVYRTVGTDWANKLIGQIIYQDLKDVVAKWDAVEDALKRMEAGLSEQYKNYVRAMIEWDLMLLRNGYYDKLRKNRVL